VSKMRAMILAAGLGTRLRPLTLERAKPAAPLVGKPIIIRLIEKLSLAGVSEFRVNLHHLPHSIQSIFADPLYADKRKVSFSFEPRILGTAGGLKANEAFFRDDTFLMANGDVVCDFDLTGALAFHRSRRPLATMILLPQERPYKFYPVFLDDEGRLTHFKEKPPPDAESRQAYVFTGIHILEPEILDHIPAGVFCEINDSVYPEIIRKGRAIMGFVAHGYWNDIGSPERYLAAHNHLLSTLDPPRNLQEEADVAIHHGARLGSGVWAEKGCVFKTGVQAQDCIFWENVTVERDVVLTRCIVGADVVVKKSYENSVITRNGSRPIE
jgi:NDP-sugar pyrophosphorylase family protein